MSQLDKKSAWTPESNGNSSGNSQCSCITTKSCFWHRCWISGNERLTERQLYEQQQQQPFNGRLSGTTRVCRYQKKHSPAHTHPGQRTSFITFLHLQRSTASSLFSLRAWQSSRTTSFQVLFGLPLGLEPSTSYSMHFFTQSSSSFRSTYQRSLFCCNINAMSSTPSLSLSSLLGSLSFSLTPHIHLTIVISACWSATTFSFLTGQVSLPCNMLLRTQLLYNLPVIIKDMSLLVSSGTNCLNSFQPILILAFTAASASPSTEGVNTDYYQNCPWFLDYQSCVCLLLLI